jgi:hypothetical protein
MAAGVTAAGPGGIRGVAVVVPARDEQHRLLACLTSIHCAAGALDVPVQVVVALDRCTDGSARIGRSWPGVVCVETDAGCVGVARALGSECALDAAGVAIGVAPHHLWLASTDADTRVPVDWLRRQVQLADQGADVVLGTIDLDRADDAAGDGVVEVWSGRYRQSIRSDGTHPHVHGANLGLRASTYLQVGGWPPRGAHEDRGLVAAARAAGSTVVATDAVRVLTSDRRDGRAHHGVAEDLRRVAAEIDHGTEVDGAAA